MSSSPICAIVLAAGTSRRMGATNKLLLPYRGRTLVAHVVHTVLAAAVDEVIVVVGHEAEAVRTALSDTAVRFVDNDRHTEGMTTSIQAGIRAAAPACAGYLICLADLPLVESADLDRLIAAFRGSGNDRAIAIPVFEGQRGNPVLFAAAYRPELLAHDEPSGGRGIVRRHSDHVIEVEMPNDHVLRDVDTPDAYARVR